MKKLLFSLFVMLFFAIQLSAQTEKGKFELSATGTLGSYTISTKYSYSYSNYSNSHEDTYKYVLLGLRPGYFLIDNLEFEPEILATFAEKDEPSFSLSANAAYNIRIPESRIVPFVLAGYGLSNSIPVLNTLLGRTSDKMDIGNLNLGLGAKVFITQSAAIRAEYRYQRFTWDNSTSYSSSSTTIDSHRLLFGISFFL